MPKLKFPISSDMGEDRRLDSFLAERIGDLSRSQIQDFIANRRILVDGQTRKAGYRLRSGEQVEIDYEPEPVFEVSPEDLPLDVIFQDRSILVIRKPSGLVVHPGAGNPNHTLVNALLFHYPEIEEIGEPKRPGLVHRLDKETSGLLVVALTKPAYDELKRQFAAREVDKMYIALVYGRFLRESGLIDRPIGRHVRHGDRMSIRSLHPRDAETRFKVLKSYTDFTLLEIKPVTGRMHQIRVHMASSGHPVVGDTRYGRRKNTAKCPRMFLHSTYLSFTHPLSGKRIEFSSPLPDDLQEMLDRLNQQAA